MQFKLTHVQTSQALGQDASTKTHHLSFTEVSDEVSPQGGVTPLLSGPSTINLRLTADEAAGYQLGFAYDLTLSVE